MLRTCADICGRQSESLHGSIYRRPNNDESSVAPTWIGLPKLLSHCAGPADSRQAKPRVSYEHRLCRSQRNILVGRSAGEALCDQTDKISGAERLNLIFTERMVGAETFHHIGSRLTG